jgi:CubicO group peptidase (beta-lactamase class C family)
MTTNPTTDPADGGARGARRAAGLVLTAVLTVLLAVLLPAAAAAAPRAVPAPPVPVPAAADLTAADVDAWLDGLLPAALERADIAGGAVTVVHEGRVLTSRGYGSADSGSTGAAPQPVDPRTTLFRIGSVSKVFTAAAVLQLVEQGRLDLDAPVQPLLDFPLPQRFEPAVTLRHLLTHTAGYEERIAGLIGTGTPGSLRDSVAVDPPEQVFAPGTVPAYSNYGYALAGYVVERVTGTPFADHVTRAVLAPLGMTSSTFAQPLPPDLQDRLSPAYATASGPPQPFEIVNAAPAGSMTASTDDMGRFLLALLDGAPELLEPSTLALMQQPGLDASTLGALAEGRQMALGLFDESRNGRRILGHGGDTQFFHSHLQFYPDERTGVFVTLNSSGRGPLDTLELRQAVLDGFADRYFPPTAPGPAPAVPGTAERAALAEGSYGSSRTFRSTFLAAAPLLEPEEQVRVTAQPDGTLLFEPGPLSLHPAHYAEIAPWVWQEVGGQRILTMRVADDGAVEAIGIEPAFTLLRTPPEREPATLLPVLLASAVVLVVGLVAWPAGAVLRRRYAVAAPAPLGRADRVATTLTRIATAAGVLALVGWALVIPAVGRLQDVPAPAIRAVQGAQLLALVGVLPAAVALVLALRRRAGAARVVGALAVLLALVGLGWVAAMSGLLQPSVSY